MKLPCVKHKIILLTTRLDHIKKGVDKQHYLVDRAVGGKHGFAITPIYKKQKHPVFIPFGLTRMMGWATKSDPDANHIYELDNIATALFDFDQHPTPISDPFDQLNAFEFGQVLGFDRRKSRFIIDRQYAYDLPTYSSVTCLHSDGKDFTRKWGGAYYLYRKDRNSLTSNISPPGVFLRGALIVRYPVVFSPYDSMLNTLYRIRCKLNIPAYDQRTENSIPYSYDGYLGFKNCNWWNLLFQGRKGKYEDGDLMTLYVQKPTLIEGHQVGLGVMMTQSQDHDLTPSLSKIVLIRDNQFQIEESKIIEDDKILAASRKGKKDNTYFRIDPDESIFTDNQLDVLDIGRTLNWSPLDRFAYRCLLDQPINVNLNGFNGL